MPSQVAQQIAEVSRQIEAKLGGGVSERFDTAFDRRLMKLCRMLAHLEISIDREPGPTLLNDAALRVEERAIDLLRRVDDRSVKERLLRRQREGFEGRTIQEAATHVLEKLFLQLGQQFEDLDEAGRRQAAERILAAIERLDPASQAEIRRRLGVDALSTDAMLRTGSIAGLGSGLGAAVAVGGFGSYTLVTSTIASVAGVFGVTLPFKFYILATSTLAFLSNPLTIAAAALGGGWLLRSKANQAIRDRYLLTLVALSIVAQGVDAGDGDPVDEFVAHSKQRYREFLGASGSDRRAYLNAFPAFRNPTGR